MMAIMGESRHLDSGFNSRTLWYEYEYLPLFLSNWEHPANYFQGVGSRRVHNALFPLLNI